MEIILASKSAARKHALETLGLQFKVAPSHLDEKQIRDPDPTVLAKKLSEAKAHEVAKQHPDALIIAGDLFVVMQGEIFEKPENHEEACAMLKKFSGKTHDILSGIAVFNTNTQTMHTSVEKIEISFRELTDDEIQKYVENYPVLECAGAYEHVGLLLFANHISGSYNFRTGFAMNKLIEFLRKEGVNA